MWASNREIREQRNAEFGVPCTCPFDARGPWDCVDCARHGEDAEAEMAAEAQAEMDAEYAWLRYAENQMEDCPDWAR